MYKHIPSSRCRNPRFFLVFIAGNIRYIRQNSAFFRQSERPIPAGCGFYLSPMGPTGKTSRQCITGTWQLLGLLRPFSLFLLIITHKKKTDNRIYRHSSSGRRAAR
jgi:hypothetical protein